ncbi:MAG: ribonuclease Z [Desulfobacterales bacterium]|nr:ribonuclease Z [Desulfobacterales bacterium]
MRPSFLPRLINDPFKDPGLYIPFLLKGRAMLFDLGENSTLSPRDLLKVSHVFVTHTHMDHFIGFDRMLRLMLGRQKDLHLFGPEGFMDNVEGKLGGYAWNLVGNDAYPLVLKVTEVSAGRMKSRRYQCRDRFRPAGDPTESSFARTLLAEPSLTVSASVLDHRIPCLGLALKERFHIHILKDRVASMGAAPGPWLGQFKAAVYGGRAPDTVFQVPRAGGSGETRFTLEALQKQIARITPGQKIAYITDTAYTPENQQRIVSLAEDADHLFIEAAFLEEDRAAAEEKAHLTARQAGRIARLSRARRMTIFHFSPRYRGREDQLYREAEEAFSGRQLS